MGTTSRVVIGMDPHKRTVTIEAMSPDEAVVDRGRFTTDVAGFEAMLTVAAAWPERVWAVEGCEGIAMHLVLRLLDAGETVVDVPAKLSARMRVYATGQGRKTDDTDAHSIALVGARMSGLREVVTTRPSRCCGCWSTGAAGSARITPAWSASCMCCCWN